jgi:hypothetical protein
LVGKPLPVPTLEAMAVLVDGAVTKLPVAPNPSERVRAPGVGQSRSPVDKSGRQPYKGHMTRLRHDCGTLYELREGQRVHVGDRPYIVKKRTRGGMGFLLFLELDGANAPREFSVHGLRIALKSILPGALDGEAASLFRRELVVWSGLHCRTIDRWMDKDPRRRQTLFLAESEFIAKRADNLRSVGRKDDSSKLQVPGYATAEGKGA